VKAVVARSVPASPASKQVWMRLSLDIVALP
jgi:hypothetical protein